MYGEKAMHNIFVFLRKLVTEFVRQETQKEGVNLSNAFTRLIKSWKIMNNSSSVDPASGLVKTQSTPVSKTRPVIPLIHHPTPKFLAELINPIGSVSASM